MTSETKSCFICESTQPAIIETSLTTEFLTVDISGVKFKILKEKIVQFPTSLLFRLLDYNQANEWRMNKTRYLPEGIVCLAPDTYFVQRSPDLFDVVLQCYSTGKFHLKHSFCKQAVGEELAFWGLNFVQTCDKCFSDVDDMIIEHARFSLTDNYVSTILPMQKAARHKVHSKKYIVFDIVSMMFIVLSTVNLVISTVPELKFCPVETPSTHISTDNNTFPYHWNNSSILTENDTNSTDMIKTVNPFHHKPSFSQDLPFVTKCLGTKVFGYIEMVCIVWFTIELIIRFMGSPSAAKFFLSPMHIIDMTAVIPYYVEIIMWAADNTNSEVSKARTLLLMLRLFRTIRIFRILKIARYSEDLRVLGATFRAAKKELFMLFLFLFIGLIIFSSVVFQLEKDEVNSGFTSIPASCWWGIVTLSTVGYGDLTTRTPGGKFIASLACVFGVLVMAFPISILVEHFTEAYKQHETKDQRRIERQESKFNLYRKKIAPVYVEHSKY